MEKLKCKLCGNTEDVSYQNERVYGEYIRRDTYCNDPVACWNRWNKEHLEERWQLEKR